MTYRIFPVLSDSPTQLEQLGTKAKFWVHQSEENRDALFKEGRLGTGENWAEKVCCEIARLLGLPHADYELAQCDGKQGVITPSFVPRDGRLILGNELLARVDQQYDPDERYKSRQHTLGRVVAVLRQQISGIPIGTPIGWPRPPQVSNAIGVFIGYLLLDALVGNQDRHHENWGFINTPEHGIVLAPTFDHASSLGRNETDKKRIDRLKTKDKRYSISNYVERARSGFFENRANRKTMHTIDAFSECVKINPSAAQYWLDRLRSVSMPDFGDILSNIPDDFISSPAREFAMEMLRINRNRLLSLNGK